MAERVIREAYKRCTPCGQVMAPGTACTVAVRVIDGQELPRNRYELIFEGMPENCNDCNAPVGGFHHPGCDQDYCPVNGCGRQAAFCTHQEQGWPGGMLPW